MHAYLSLRNIAMPDPLLLDRVELAPQELVHGKHVDLVLLKDSLQLLVAEDLTLVVGILELVAFDVIPELLDDLGT